MNRRFPRTWQTVDENYRAFQQQQREFDELLHPPGREPRKPKRKRRESDGPRLLSEQQIEKAKAYYNGLLDKDDRRNREKAAKHIAVEFLGLDEGSWQTVKTWVVQPVLDARRKK
jgi:hypothetical protein